MADSQDVSSARRRKPKKARRKASNAALEIAARSAEEAACRICLADEEDGEPLLRPCRCDGSMRWAHSSCVAEWLRLSPAAPLRCEICGEDFDVVFGEDGPARGLAYFDFELDDPEFEDGGLLITFFVSLAWMCLMFFVEKLVFVLDLLPLWLFPGRDWLLMVIDIAMAIVYTCCIIFKVSILIAGGADWQPEDWGAFFARTDIFFKSIETFLADFGFGLPSLACFIGTVSVKSIISVAMSQPLQRCANYCGVHAVLLSGMVNIVAIAWMLKRAFLDQQPLVSEVKGELFRACPQRE